MSTLIDELSSNTCSACSLPRWEGTVNVSCTVCVNVAGEQQTKEYDERLAYSRFRYKAERAVDEVFEKRDS